MPESAPAAASKPFLRMDGRFPDCGSQHWVSHLPFWAVTHLTIHGADGWPGVFVALSAARLQQLRVLDIQFPYSCDTRDEAVSLDSNLRLTHLYMADSSFKRYDFAHCTSLVSLNIMHISDMKPALSLPPFLTRLCLHGTLPASRDPELQNLDKLVSIKLGGRASGIDTTRQLPSLPYSTTELDLWDGLLTSLQQLTRLTNLKKLSMPDRPTQQQLHIILQLRQLRWLDVIGCQGMFQVCALVRCKEWHCYCQFMSCIAICLHLL